MKQHPRPEVPPPGRGVVARLGTATGPRMARFAAVGVSGTAVNLVVLEVLAGRLGWPGAAASAAAIEASILTNFFLNDRFTFRDRRAGASLLRRLLAFHAVTAVGAIVQLGVFVALSAILPRALGRDDLGALRHVAQLAGISVAFAWNFFASAELAWRAPSAAPRALARAAAPLLFFALLLLHALPMWLVDWFPTQDGPLHVENVLALLGHAHSPLLQHFYVANWGAQPNWLTQAILAALLQGGLAPATGEKVILTGYSILLPLLFRAALPRGERGWWAALGVFPFVHAFPFHMGFWNFCWGLVLYFGTLAIWARHRGRLGVRRFAALAAVSVLLFFAHSVAFAALCISVAALLGWRVALALRRARGRPARRRTILAGYLRRGAAVATALAPGALLLASWLAAHRDRASARIPLHELAARLASLYALVSIDRREVVLAAAVSLALAVAVVHVVLARASRPLRLHDGWLVAAAAFAVLYFAVPDVAANGAHISDRLVLFAALCALAWVGSGSAPRAAVRRLGVALAAVALLALGVRMDKQRELSGYLDEYLSARDAVRPGSVLLPLALSPWGPPDEAGRRLGYRVKPFLHAAGWILAERGGVDLKNSQANTDHCPLRWPEGRNPFHTIALSLGAMEAAPPCVNLRAGAPGGGAIDYVLVWGATREATSAPCGAALERQLESRWERVFVSRPRGMLEVWRPRPSETASWTGAPPPPSDLVRAP